MVRVWALVQVVEFNQLLVLDVLLYLLEGGSFGVVDSEHFPQNLLKLFADVRVRELHEIPLLLEQFQRLYQLIHSLWSVPIVNGLFLDQFVHHHPAAPDINILSVKLILS